MQSLNDPYLQSNIQKNLLYYGELYINVDAPILVTHSLFFKCFGENSVYPVYFDHRSLPFSALVYTAPKSRSLSLHKLRVCFLFKFYLIVCITLHFSCRFTCCKYVRQEIIMTKNSVVCNVHIVTVYPMKMPLYDNSTRFWL